MTGGDPPHPPSRSPYPPWQPRPYRRRGPPSSAPPRNTWAPRRPRSSPPPSPMRIRHSRSVPPKHLRHPLHPPPPQSHSAVYHPPPPTLSRSLQSRLRPSSRSPPRRLDPPPLRTDPHPYRGEPGPSHRIDVSERTPYRPTDSVDHSNYRPPDYPYPPQRPPPSTARPDPPPYRSEQVSHRASTDHHVPYRGEPGPLYRADGASLREDVDSRRPAPDSHPRNDSQPSHGSWFRNPAKIHKPPLKIKKRRIHTHPVGLSRIPPQQLMKSESPLLARVGFVDSDRPGPNRVDNAPSTQFSAKPLSNAVHPPSMRWQNESVPKGAPGLSPRASHAQDHDGVKRVDYGSRGQTAVGDAGRRIGGHRDQHAIPVLRTSDARMELQGAKMSDGPYDGPKFMGSRPVSALRPTHDRSPMRVDNSNQSLMRSNAAGGWRGPENKFGNMHEAPSSMRGASPKRERKSPVDQKYDRGADSRPLGLTSRQVDAREHLTAIRRNEANQLRGRRDVPNSFDRAIPPNTSASFPKTAVIRTRHVNEGSAQSSANVLPAQSRMNAPLERPGRPVIGDGRMNLSDPELLKERRPVPGSVPVKMGPERELQTRDVPVISSSGGSSIVRCTPLQSGKQQANIVHTKERTESSELGEEGGRQSGSEKGNAKVRKASTESDIIQLDKSQDGEGSPGSDVVHMDIKFATNESRGIDAKGKTEENTAEKEAKTGLEDILPECTQKGDIKCKEEVTLNEPNSVDTKKQADSVAKNENDPVQRSSHGQTTGARKIENEDPLTASKASKPREGSHEDVPLEGVYSKKDLPLQLKEPSKLVDHSEAKQHDTGKIELRSVLSSLQLPTLDLAKGKEIFETDKDTDRTKQSPRQAEEKANLPSKDAKDGNQGEGLRESTPAKEESAKEKRPGCLDLRTVLSSTISLASTPIPRGRGSMENESKSDAKACISLQLRSMMLEEEKDNAGDVKVIPSFESGKLFEKVEGKEDGSKTVMQNTVSQSQVLHGDAVKAPIAVPVPALSLLRSSPKPDVSRRLPDPEKSTGLIKDLSKPVVVSSEPGAEGKQSDTKKETNSLVERIYQLDGEIASLERRLAQAKALRRANRDENVSKAVKRKKPDATTTVDNDFQYVSQLAQAVSSKADQSKRVSLVRSHNSVNGALRLIMVQNQARAAAAAAALRPVCMDMERGLDADPYIACMEKLQIPEELRSTMTEELSRRHALATEKRKKLSSEYRDLRSAWVRKLKSARDKKSKEKREAIRERDRFLVLHTKGQNARLSSRTSSGRMSTKIFPTLNASGVSNGTADADALLAEIAAEGGTPGSKDIWSRTLAEIPDQDASRVPADCCSVRVENPMGEFHASRAVNPWQFHERLIFLEKYLTYQKNFRKISAFLEHKSARDCSYFYYLHKLTLGLKQLTKEASTLKRKGLLRAHIVTLAKKRLSCEPEEYVSAQITAFLARSQVGSISYAPQKALPSSDASTSMSGPSISVSAHLAPEKKHVIHMNMMMKKKVISEHIGLDLSDIDRDVFSQALSKFGTDWKEVAAFMALPNKTLSHYREFYRRNRRKLRQEDIEKSVLGKAATPLRSPTVSLRHSPRIVPKSSPHSGPSPEHQKPVRNLDALELEPIQLLNGEGRNSGKRSRKSSSPILRTSSVNQTSPSETLVKESEKTAVQAGESETRRHKTTKWTAEEGETFKRLFKTHGRDWKKIAQIMSPKTPMQVKGYWRTVAHEVGNGIPSDSTKRRKARRSASSEGGRLQGSREQEDRKATPKKREATVVKQTEARSNFKLEAAPDADSNVEGRGVGEDCNKVLMKKGADVGNSEQNDEEQRSGKGRDMDGTSEERTLRQGVGSLIENKTGKDRTAEVKGDERERLAPRLQMLRSAPIPILRSVPVQDQAGTAGAAGAGAPREEKASGEDGVLELLGRRLSNAKDAQSKQQ